MKPCPVNKTYGPWMERRTISGVASTLKLDPDVWVETDTLMAALIDNAREPMPPSVVSYLRLRLNREARKRRGRGRFGRSPVKALRNHLISTNFERYEAWLVSRKDRLGLEGWSGIRGADWWQGPPSERAARIVTWKLRKLPLNLSWQRVRDIAYDQRRS